MARPLPPPPPRSPPSPPAAPDRADTEPDVGRPHLHRRARAHPLTSNEYLELLPVRWQPVTERGIRLNHRTYDHDLLAAYRGQPSPHTTRGGKWEIHTNPHDIRQIWLRLPDGTFAEIPWIHRSHVHRSFIEQTFHHIRATLPRHTDPDSHEAGLADALDHLMRRARTGHTTPAEIRLLTRTKAARTPLLPRCPAGPRSPSRALMLDGHRYTIHVSASQLADRQRAEPAAVRESVDARSLPVQPWIAERIPSLKATSYCRAAHDSVTSRICR